MWVSKPIYESLPYFYLITGIVSLSASMYLNHWYWPTICFVVGLGSLVGGLVVEINRDVAAEDHIHGSEKRNLRLVQQIQMDEVDISFEIVGYLPESIFFDEVLFAHVRIGLPE